MRIYHNMPALAYNSVSAANAALRSLLRSSPRASDQQRSRLALAISEKMQTSQRP